MRALAIASKGCQGARSAAAAARGLYLPKGVAVMFPGNESNIYLFLTNLSKVNTACVLTSLSRAASLSQLLRMRSRES